MVLVVQTKNKQCMQILIETQNGKILLSSTVPLSYPHLL